MLLVESTDRHDAVHIDRERIVVKASTMGYFINIKVVWFASENSVRSAPREAPFLGSELSLLCTNRPGDADRFVHGIWFVIHYLLARSVRGGFTLCLIAPHSISVTHGGLPLCYEIIGDAQA